MAQLKPQGDESIDEAPQTDEMGDVESQIENMFVDLKKKKKKKSSVDAEAETGGDLVEDGDVEADFSGLKKPKKAKKPVSGIPIVSRSSIGLI